MAAVHRQARAIDVCRFHLARKERQGKASRHADLLPRARVRVATNRLARRLPAAILADLLGYADTTTERWTKLAAGDWTRYAANRPATTL